MTFKEAKAEADRIGGVVDWWWVYSVYPAAVWAKFNGTHGYGKYHSKGALAFFRAEYRRWRKERKLELQQFRKLWAEELQKSRTGI